MNEMYYAGIGSREIPEEIKALFETIGYELAKLGFVLRSGAANGSDSAFENGCNKVSSKKEIWLPWKGFNGSDSKNIVCDPRAFAVAKLFHPNWEALSDAAKKLMARNSHQILGKELNREIISSFVVCYTKNGAGAGGTGQAIRIARHYGIPIFDAGGAADLNKFEKEVLTYANSLIDSDKTE